MRRELVLELSIPIGFFVASEVGQVCECLINPRIKAVAQEGQDLVAETVAGVGAVVISCVLAPGEGVGSQPGFNLAAVDFKERADESFARDRQDSGETRESRPAEDAVEDGFGLIVARVTCSDAIDYAGCDQAGIEGQAGVAGGLFEVTVHGGDVGLMEVKRERERGGELGDEFGIGLGSGAANAVINVGDAELEVPARGQFAEGVQKEDGIRSARNRDAEALSGGEHAMAGDGVGDAIEHSARIIPREGGLVMAGRPGAVKTGSREIFR